MPNLPTKYTDCVTKIVNDSKGKVTEEEATSIVEKTFRDAGIKGDKIENPTITQEQLLKMRAGIDTKLKMERGQAKLSALKQVQANRGLMAKADMSLKSVGKRGKRVIKSAGESVMNVLVGSEKSIAGVGGSAQTHMRGVLGRTLSEVMTEIDANPKMSEAFRNNHFAKEIHNDLFYMNTEGPGSKKFSGNDVAYGIAQVWSKHNESMLLRKRRAGAAVGRLDHYTIHQAHDADRILDAGGKVRSQANKEKAFLAWKQDISTKLDERTFDGVLDAERDKFYKGIYEAIITGHGKLDPEYSLQGSGGQGSLSKKLAASRKLIFKDAKSEWDYMQDYGRKNFRDALIQDLSANARNLSLMEFFGPNPQAGYNALKQHVRLAAEGMDNFQKEAAGIRKFFNDPDATFKQMTGELDIPHDVTAARWQKIAMDWQVAVNMQNVSISAVGDIPMSYFALHETGASKFNLLGNQIKRLFDVSGPGREAARAAAVSQGVFHDSFMGSVNGRFVDSKGSASGWIEWTKNTTFKLNLMNHINHALRTAFAETVAHDMAAMAGKTFDQLAPIRQRLLSKYEISPDIWDAMRGTTYEVEGRFSKHVTMGMDGLARMDDAVIERLLANRSIKATQNNKAKMRDEVFSKYFGMMRNEIDGAVLQPGAREMAISKGNAQAGTLGGVAGRFMGMYKSFPLVLTERAVKRAMYGGMPSEGIHALTNSSTLRMLGLLASLTISGYSSMALHDLRNLRSRRKFKEDDNAFNAKLLLAAFERGGALGIFNDFLFSAMDKQYDSPALTLTGPFIQNVADISLLAGGAMKGKDVRRASRRALERNIPLYKILAIGPALNYAFLWSLQEAWEPGSLLETQIRAEEQNNQTFLVEPR